MSPFNIAKKNIGVFDSGIGGLWILKFLRENLPEYNYIFFGDQSHVPYGERPMEEIREFSLKITEFLINKDCKVIVIACNTASAASLKFLRDKFPDIVFVGLEPAVKSGVELTNTKKVGVLATSATFQGELYNTVVGKFAHNIKIYKDTCPGLVNQIEKNDLSSDKTKYILENALNPMLKKGIDTIILGCTHYPFVIPLIKEIVGAKVSIIDPTDAIVRRVSNILNKDSFEISAKGEGSLDIFTSGKSSQMKPILLNLFNKELEVREMKWDIKNDLKIANNKNHENN